MKNYFYAIACFLLLGTVGNAQTTYPPVYIEHATFLGESVALRDLPVVESSESRKQDDDQVREIPNNLRNAPKLNPNALPLGPDPLAQTQPTFRAPQELLMNFDGIDINEGQAIPPDPTGAVGPNHYVHSANLVVKIFDKEGNTLVGPVSLGSFLGNGSSNGDPIVMYDQLEDRFFVSQFQISTNALIIGISKTPDPTGIYNIYSFPLDAFPDYPHYSVWPNAYYLAANKFQGNVIYALDKETMLMGGPDPAIIGFNLPGVIRNPNTVFGPQAANLLGNIAPVGAPGYFVYLQDDSWATAITFDQLKIWKVMPDFVTPASSLISVPQVIPVTDFDSTFGPFGQGDIEQPGTNQKLDSQSGLISYMANFRSFADHNSFLVNFNTDVGAGRIGIRWIELRNVDLDPFEVFQEGTWTRDDGENRFMGSTAMDEAGNIALAYSIGSENTKPSLRFTGRLADDPLGQMSFEEQTIKDGISSGFSSNRFGDYSQMTMDPDGVTFWFTSEYFRSANAWRTRIASFNLDNLPVLGLTTIDQNPLNVSVYPLNEGIYEIFAAVNANGEDMKFQVFDIQGKQITQGELNPESKGYRGTFNSGNMTGGIYLVKVLNASSTSTLKVIIK